MGIKPEGQKSLFHKEQEKDSWNVVEITQKYIDGFLRVEDTSIVVK